MQKSKQQVKLRLRSYKILGNIGAVIVQIDSIRLDFVLNYIKHNFSKNK
jgi:hypothetical protein